ncbi:BQ2448_3284 [Microbotryum intermedium]|uniref:Lysophospholipase n=1 Tax=Microbotryum intermedium TaxID=269621 RepID=A0A238FKV3_9BASI|nr:BQ2448_3284 [Microbotryum intermedium]
MLFLSLVSFLGLCIGAVKGEASSYAPRRVPCPRGPLVTSAGSPLAGDQTLESREAIYQIKRWIKVLQPLYAEYLGVGGDTGYSAAQNSMIVRQQPRTGIACSGGGLRASLYCAGTLSALDSRSGTHIAPVLQLAAYMSGLSGGSWAVTSLAMADLGPTSIYDIVMGTNGAPGWKLDLDMLLPTSAPWHLIPFEANIIRDLNARVKAGFSVSFIDYWVKFGSIWVLSRRFSLICSWLAGRLLGHHFLPGTTRESFFKKTPPNDNVSIPTQFTLNRLPPTPTNSLGCERFQGVLFESIKSTSNFIAHQMPYPIVVTTSRVVAMDQFKVDGDFIPLQNTIFEISPFSFGSFDASLSAHILTEFMGTFVDDGKSGERTTCVNGFDSASLIMGSSAALFTAVESMLKPTASTRNKIVAFLKRISKAVPAHNRPPGDFLTSKVPNSFYSYNPRLNGSRSFESSQNHFLHLTDGGMGGENLPFNALLVKARALDTVFAIDASHNTDSAWPNGKSLLRTVQRIREAAKQYTDFPPLPDSVADFLRLGLTQRPVFFGCDVKDARVGKPGNYPIIIYLPNAPVPNSQYSTNTPTTQMHYSNPDTLAFLDTAHANAMKGFPLLGATTDPHYATALKCAIVDRARQRAALARSTDCQNLFARCRFIIFHMMRTFDKSLSFLTYNPNRLLGSTQITYSPPSQL